MKNLKLVILLTMGILPLLAMGCASIVTGTSQQVNISSKPSGASATIDPGNIQGTTPFSVTLKKGRSYTVTATKAGYATATQTIGTHFNGWFVGNLLFGGIIGIIIDLADGAVSNLDDKVHIDMSPTR